MRAAMGRHRQVLGGQSHGQLGLGDTSSRGALPGEMGDNLLALDLGAGVLATRIVAGYAHTCALLGGDDTIKCWGGNDAGQLGLGDPSSRGASPDSMGDALFAVELW